MATSTLHDFFERLKSLGFWDRLFSWNAFLQQSFDAYLEKTVNREVKNIENPKLGMLEPLDKQISGLRMEKVKKDSLLLTLRPIIEHELREQSGFLDELDLMYGILKDKLPARIIWIVWFFFLFSLELLVLFSKMGGDTNNDYESVILQQMDIHNKKLELHRERL